MIPLLLLLLIKYFSQYIERLIDWSTLFPSEYVQLFFLKSLSVSNFHPFHFRLILYGLKITSLRTKACTQSLHPICVVPFLTQSLFVSLKMNKNTIGWSTVDPSKLYHVPKALKSSTTLVKRLVVVLKVSTYIFYGFVLNKAMSLGPMSNITYDFRGRTRSFISKIRVRGVARVRSDSSKTSGSDY